MSHDEMVLKEGSVLRSEHGCCLCSGRLLLRLRYPGFAAVFMVTLIGYITYFFLMKFQLL